MIYSRKDAVISECGQYRYTLLRVWDERLPKVMFIGLNPSVADADRDDFTLKRCVAYARDWGYGGVLIGNLFAYRSTDPKALKHASDPIGSENDIRLKRLADKAEIVVAVWGNHGTFMHRGDAVRKQIPRLHYLALTQKGEPHHPRGLPGCLGPKFLASIVSK